MKMSDWTLIQTLYECRNLTKAAELLYLSQPTLTKRLQLLEEEFGVTIAIRNKRGITFTPEGEYLAVKAAQISNIMEEIHEHLSQSHSEPFGTLMIGASNSMTRSSLPGILQEYRRRHPHIQFEITTERSSQIAKLVERGKLDLGFINGEIPFSGKKVLYHVEQAYLASTTPIDLTKLAQEPYITYQKDHYTQILLEQWWKEYFAVPFPLGLTVQHGDICKEMILKGLGYSIFFVRDYMAGHPEYIQLLYHKDGQPLTRNTWLIYTDKTRENPVAQNFIQEIIKKDAL